jgi:protease I
MAIIGVIVADMFEDSEYEQPVRAFKNAGHAIASIGLADGLSVTGKTSGTTVVIDASCKNTAVNSIDALLIPGGYSPDKLRADDDAVLFVKQFFETGKPVFAICHGPQLLISACVLEGRTLTGWKSIAQDIRNAGATYVDREAVVDGKLVSSRCPDDLPAFIKAALGLLPQAKKQ